MSEAEAGTTKQPDPMEKFRELRNAYLDIWSKNLIEAVNSDGYAQASGAALENYLNISTPYKEVAEQAMLRTLQQLNMPSSADFAGLAGRFTNFEMQLDNMDAKLDRIEKLLSDRQPVTPVATKKPTAAAEPPAGVNQSAKLSEEAPKPSKVTEPAEGPAPVKQKLPEEAPKQVKVAESAEKSAPSKQPAVTPRDAPKRTATAKPLRRNARKGAK